MIECLTTEEEKLKVFFFISHEIARTDLLPELLREQVQDRIKALMDWSRVGYTYVAKTEHGLAVVILVPEERNPHIEGNGLSVQITLSTAPDALRELMRYVFREARKKGHDWVQVTKHVDSHEYRIKFIRLRK